MKYNACYGRHWYGDKFEIFATDLSRFEVKREDHRKEVNETSDQVHEQLKDIRWENGFAITFEKN